MFDFIIVGIGGFIGCCLRLLISKIIHTDKISISTILSNVIAGFMVGCYIGFERRLQIVSPNIKIFVVTGILGGLSTFSTFSFETLKLFEERNYFFALVNVICNVGLSLLATFFGIKITS